MLRRQSVSIDRRRKRQAIKIKRSFLQGDGVVQNLGHDLTAALWIERSLVSTIPILPSDDRSSTSIEPVSPRTNSFAPWRPMFGLAYDICAAAGTNDQFRIGKNCVTKPPFLE